MKLFLLIVCVIGLVSTACKPGALSTDANAGANTNANQITLSTGSSNPDTQSKCSLKLAGAPAVSGLRLGMTADEVVALFPGSKEDPDLKARLARPAEKLGTSQFVIHPDKYESKASFAGISQIVFSFFDGRLFNIYVGYNGPQYSHVDQFVEKVSQQFSLPPASQWDAFVGMDTTLKTLKCAEFHVEAFIGGKSGSLNHLTVKDLVAEKKLNDRSAKAEATASP